MSRLSAGLANEPITLDERVVTLPTGTQALDPAKHANRLLLISTADVAYTINLPRAVGSGDIYRFLVTVAHTSGSIIINASPTAPSNKFLGTIKQITSTGVVVTFQSTTNDIITLNNTTTGAFKAGDSIEIQDVALATWLFRDSSLTVSAATGSTPLSG